MCGIAGEVRFDGADADLAALARCTARMTRCGPDSGGAWTSGPIGFGHRRLKIIDLSAARSQPMIDAQLGLSVVFNGCLYNYKTLRADLERRGHWFFSQSDTEVLHPQPSGIKEAQPGQVQAHELVPAPQRRTQSRTSRHTQDTNRGGSRS